MAAGDIPGIATRYMKDLDIYQGLAATNLETARAAQDMLDEIRKICLPFVNEAEKYGAAELVKAAVNGARESMIYSLEKQALELDEIRLICAPVVANFGQYGTAALVREALKAVQRGHKENCEALLAIRKTCVPLFSDGSSFTTVGLVEKLVEEHNATRGIWKHLVSAYSSLSGHDDNGRGFTMLGLAECVAIMAERSADELKKLRLAAEPASDFTRACLSRARRKFEAAMTDEPEGLAPGLHEDRIVTLVERLRRELAETRKWLEDARAIRQTIREICEPLVDDTRCEVVELVRRATRAAAKPRGEANCADSV